MRDRQCWGCGGWFHGQCLGGFRGRALGPYHCPGCLGRFGKEGVRDITLHEKVIDRVMGDSAGGDSAEDSNRIARIASWFKWESQKLWLKADTDREVPPICARSNLIATAAK